MNYLRASTTENQAATLMVAWLPALLGLTVICLESTSTMSGANTGRWLDDLIHSLGGQLTGAPLDVTNLLLRKVGHFLGYGTLGLLFRRGWMISLRRTWVGPRSRLPFSAAALAVVCTFFVACVDEVHQSFLVGRTSSFYDVILDTVGAILFIKVGVALMERRRRAVLAGALGRD